MRSYSVIAIILLLSSLVLAQEVTITVSKTTVSTVDVNPDHLFKQTGTTSQPIPPQPFSYSFSSPKYVAKIVLNTRGFRCYQYCWQYTSICLLADNDYATRQCKEPPHYYENKDLVYTFSPPRNINSISVTIGGQYPQYTAYYLNSFALDAGSDTATIKTSILGLRSDGPIDFGAIRTRINPEGYTGKYLISSSSPKAPAWFDDGGKTSAIDRKETTIAEDNIFACLDSDQNQICDYKDEADCLFRTPSQDWYKGDCCGDAPFNPITETPSSECKWYATTDAKVKDAVCGKNSEAEWKWAALEDIGLIVALSGGCPAMELVSDGTKFYTCTTGTQSLIPTDKIQQLTGKIDIEGHEYFCQGETIIECGGDAPYSLTAKTSGTSITYNNQKHYCTTEGKWVTSLDAAGRDSCVAAELKWTGTKCCGETDDPLNTYEDTYTGQGTAGACYNNNFIASGSFFSGDKSLINFRGKFVICDPTKQPGTSAPTTTPLLTGITPTAYGPCGTPLQQAILIGTLQHIICTPSGDWQFTSKTEAHIIKQTLWQPSEIEKKQGCCTENQCWDGAQCRDAGYYYDKIAGKGYRCE